MSIRKPCYIWDPLLISQCDRLPAVPNRASLVNDLLIAYQLNDSLQVIRSTPASYADLKQFHLESYLDHLKHFQELEDDYMTNEQDEEYGIGYDCPPISNMYELVSVIAGGSVTAAKCLLLGITDVAINWCGGWHHAYRFAAKGFCYVNDIVIAINKLRIKFKKVLYIDLDVHHGNGVQDAFELSESVFTLSFHKYEPGFYPGSGNIDDIGSSIGKGYSCNFPLHAFYTDKTLETAFGKWQTKHPPESAEIAKRPLSIINHKCRHVVCSQITGDARKVIIYVFPLVYSKFNPDAIVMQCGADGLVSDPNGGACLTEKGYTACLHKVLATKKPILLLGGGGYNHPNAARLWTQLTAVAARVDLDDDIPEHDDWPQYGPDYKLLIRPSLTKDRNTEHYLGECIEKIKYNLELLLKEIAVVPRKENRIRNRRFKLTLDNKLTSVQKGQVLEDSDLEKETRLKPIEVQMLPEKDNKTVDVYEFQE